MYDLLLIISCITFYFLGRYSGHEQEVVTQVRKTIQKRLRPPGGVITYATPQDLKYAGSEQEKIDKQAEQLMRDAGLK